MELVPSASLVGEVSSNGIVVGNPSNHMLEEGPVVQGLSESLLGELPDKCPHEEIQNKCLLEEAPKECPLEEEVSSESLPGGQIACYNLPEEIPTDSFPEAVPSEYLSEEVLGASCTEELQSKIVINVKDICVAEKASSLELSQNSENGFVEVLVVEGLVIGAKESNVTEEGGKMLDCIIEDEVIKLPINGWTPDVYDASVLLPSWTQARVPGPAIVISDMRGVDSLNYSKAEKLLRCKLAAAYRLVDVLGWSDGVNANISVLTKSGEVLVTAFGILHHEVTSSNLVKVSLGGDIIDPGSTGLCVDTDDLMMHAAIYRSRDDVRCIMRFSSPIVVSFSTLKCGLLPLCPEAMELGEITYSEYFGAICGEEDEAHLGLLQHRNSKVMVLRNFGVVVCGDSVEQAFDVACNVFAAIETQFNVLPVGLVNIYVPSEEKQRVVLETTSESPPDIHPPRIDRRLEDVRFEGFMRMLDGAGYQTGYVYRFPMVSKRTARSQSLMEVAHSPKSTVSDASRAHDQSLQVSYESSRSVTPSSQRPASVMNTKSVIENGQSCRTPSHRFVPLGTDVREYKQKVKEIRKDFIPNRATAGPHSTVLEGVTWDEARRIQESHAGGGGIKVTAASRGIIQRDHQKSAVFYKEFSAGNPFDAVSKKELDDYVHEVQRKTVSPAPPSTMAVSHDLVEAEPSKPEPVKELTQQERPNSEQEMNKITTGPGSRVTAPDQKLKVENEPKNESQDVTQRIIESPVSSEKKENIAAGSLQDNISPTPKVKQPGGSLEQPPIEQEKAEPGKVGRVSSETEKKPPQPSQVLSPVVSVKVKQEEQLTQEVAHSMLQDTSLEGQPTQHVLTSKSAKLKKSQSMMESDTNKVDSLLKESGAEGVELQTKDKKKKRGLSAIFSKKKEK